MFGGGWGIGRRGWGGGGEVGGQGTGSKGMNIYVDYYTSVTVTEADPAIYYPLYTFFFVLLAVTSPNVLARHMAT